MPTPFRTLSALFLALVLAATSTTMAVARGQAQAGLPVTICDSEGTRTIYLDAEGEPIHHEHPCPYCILAHVLPPDRAAVTPSTAPALTCLRPALPATPAAGRACAPPQARAPPCPV